MLSDKTIIKRKPYEKPMVRVIELNADEVLAVSCKINSTTTKAFGNTGVFGTCLLPRRCNSVGS